MAGASSTAFCTYREDNGHKSMRKASGQDAASPPQMLSVSEVLETAHEISKLTIAHEMVLNQDFKLQAVTFAPNSLENRVKEALHRAFWDRLKEQLSASPPDYTQAIQLLQEIKEALLSLLLPRHDRLRRQIEEALDLELLRQEAEHGALDVGSVAARVLDTMAALCAPARDEDVRALRSLADPVQLLREIFRVLDLMKMDMLNFTIQSLRPHLQEHSVQYERKKFQELLDKLPRSIATSCPLSVASRHPLVLQTLFMDQARLQQVRSQVNQLVLIAAVLLVTSGMCGSTLFGSPGFVARLKRVTKVLLEGLSCTRCEEALQDVGDQVLQEVGRTLSQLGYPPFSKDKCTSLKGQIRSLADKDNAVRRVVEQRIHSFLSLFVSPNGQSSPKDLPKGLDAVQEELLALGRRFGSVIHHNRQVFAPYYSEILRKVLEPEPDAGADSL
ncbi:PREDICTED: T-complex protein 11 homolog [Tinamus guttatus]|uniref:T-complex protein 11 homolog n=1 Tax=Tinamus guttatus TaxID=94827 RepID=UPI00052EB4D6|nr:PREDICTED: T-complex protein 11 homolog [Tinamus guttatus]